MLRLLRFRDLEYFIAVAERRSFARAAEAIGISQPTLSNQIRRLEELFDQKLLERAGKDVVPTPEGLKALYHMKAVMQAFDEMNAARSGADTLRGKTLKIGLIPSIAPYLSGALLNRVGATGTGARIELLEALTQDLEARLIASEIDIAIAATLPSSPSLQVQEIGEEAMVYLSRDALPKDPFARTAERPILLLQEGNCFRDLVHASIKRLSPPDAVRFGEAIGSASLLTLAALTRQGIGDTVLPVQFTRAFPELVEDLHTRPLDRKTFSRRIYVLSRKARAGNQDIKALTTLARDAHHQIGAAADQPDRPAALAAEPG